MDISIWPNYNIESLESLNLSNGQITVKSNIFGATKDSKCQTCFLPFGACQGHWRKLELPQPIVRPSFTAMLNTLISKLCLHCGLKIPVTEEQEKILQSHYPFIAIQTKEYINVVRSIRTSSDNATKCKKCGTAPHKLKLSNGTFTDGSNIVSHETIFRLLNSIPLHYYPLFTNIKFPLTDMFFTAYPIAPLYIRSGVDFENLVIDSEITKRYQDMIAKLSSLNIPAIQRAIDQLEFNESAMPNSSFAKPFLGKYTLFRSLINSYTGDNSVRTVLSVHTTPSPDIGYFCREFYNLVAVKIYYNNYTHHLIESIKSEALYAYSNGRHLRVKGPITLQGGDYIEVLARDGNKIGYRPNMISYRQPSLHKPSIIAQTILPRRFTYANGITNTLSIAALPGCNGDQDGDEFNSRMVSTVSSQYEHLMLMRPRMNLINDSTSSLTYGLIQVEVLQFIKLLKRHGRTVYSDLLPHCLRDAEFENINTDEVSATKKTTNLFKNVQQLSSPLDGWRLFVRLIKRVKNSLGREKMAFMLKEIDDARSFIRSMTEKRNNDMEILQRDIIKLSQDGLVVTDKLISDMLGAMIKDYEKSFKTWIEKEDILSNDYALITYAGLKVNPKLLMELLLLQRSESIVDISNYYYRRPNAIYPISTLDLNGRGVITGCYFDGLEFKDLCHTFAPAGKKLIITSVMTALPGMISRNMSKTLEDTVIDYMKFVVTYGMVIDTCHNFYKLPTSQLFLIPTKNRKQMLFPLDLPFIMKNIHTLMPSNNSPMTLEAQSNMIHTFAHHITNQYMYSFGCVHEYLIEVLSELPLLPKEVLQYIHNLIETKYKLYPAVGEPIGVHTATTIGEILTQSSLSNFHSVKKGGDEISLDADAINIGLIQYSRSKVDRVIKIKGSPDKLHVQRVRLEAVSLEDLGYELIYQNTKKSRQIDAELKFSLRRKRLDDKYLTVADIEEMIAKQLDTLSYIVSASVETYVMKYHIGVTLKCRVTNEEGYRLLLISLSSIQKGYYRCSIVNNTLLIEASDITFLASMDTTDMVISMQPQLIEASPMMSHQSLLDNYSVAGISWLPYRTLAMFQTRYGFPIGIRKYDTVGQPVVSKLSHQKAFYDLQKAAAVREPQLSCVPGSILLNQPIKLGSGYFNISQDIGMYLKAETTKKQLNQLIL